MRVANLTKDKIPFFIYISYQFTSSCNHSKNAQGTYKGIQSGQLLVFMELGRITSMNSRLKGSKYVKASFQFFIFASLLLFLVKVSQKNSFYFINTIYTKDQIEEERKKKIIPNLQQSPINQPLIYSNPQLINP